MRRKIPFDACAYYLSLGSSRSYEAVAKHYNVSKRAVTNLAVREGWQAQAAAADAEGRARSIEKAKESIVEMNERHLKTLQLVQKMSLETLRQTPLTSAMDAVRSLVMAVRDERLIRGEPTDRTELDLNEIVKRETERWLVPASEERNGHAE